MIDRINIREKKLSLGKAGEFFVAAQLIRLGLNASPLPVDTGVDLVAQAEMAGSEKLLQAEHLLYQFQVKTTATSEYKASWPKSKFEELWRKVINLVVVFWPENRCPVAVVLPPRLIFMLTSGGFKDPIAPFKMTREEVSFRVIESKGEYFVRNRHNRVTAMVNRFDRVEPVMTETTMLPEYACWADLGKTLINFD